ncbi:hypothetical protein [Paraflavitalea pollutisoli]|uniref:hypothetical protein n=1 Tax=Paraflavitalea pollutisoli TaxID=3034143 RepID=UPI0023ED1456|nr:hypothetical protein [Paraflavitalea sp. H1-2-19X]
MNNTQDNINEFIQDLRQRLAADYPNSIILLKTEGAYLSIREDAELISYLLNLPLREPTARIPVVHTVFPLHAFDQYVGILNKGQLSVGVCSQENSPDGALSPRLHYSKSDVKQAAFRLPLDFL